MRELRVLDAMPAGAVQLTMVEAVMSAVRTGKGVSVAPGQ